MSGLGEQYDQVYYDRHLGPIPYRRSERAWLELFGGLADRIVDRLAPRTVLDVGCAKGFLVEALRDRGVEAFGVDASAYALSCVREDVRLYCRQGDAARLDTGERFDLVVCLETLEHMPAAEAEAALSAMAQVAPRVLFSSTPDDFDEPTHVNVQPVAYWVERFAAAGLWPDPVSDFTFLAPHAVLFKRSASETPPTGVHAAWIERMIGLARERAALAQRAQDAEARAGGLREDLVRIRGELREMQHSQAWQLLMGLRARKEQWLPEGSLRRRALTRATQETIHLLRGHVAPSLPVALKALAGAAERPRVLVVSGCGGDSRRYRCQHLLEALTKLGGAGVLLEADSPTWAEGLAPKEVAAGLELLVLQRVALTPALDALIGEARRQGKPVLFETDDLLFDPDQALGRVPGLARMVPPGDLRGQRATLLRCDAALCATNYLRERIEELGRRAFVLRNGFSEGMRATAAGCSREPGPKVVLGYASGSPTHDGDFAVAAPALLELLEARPDTELHLLGPLQVDRAFERFGPRVRRYAKVHWRELPARLARFDVNLAPLDLERPFCLGKSELKYLEAALVGVPTVASSAPAFRHAIADGVDGFLAGTAAAWRERLHDLVTQPSVRQEVGQRARVKVLAEYSLSRRARDLAAIVASLGGAGGPNHA